jgi:hypothetical protein
MTQTCPACGNELWKPETQHFCGSCGEPINVEVDRDRTRRDTSGLLEPHEVSRIAKNVQGGGGELHDYTHVRVQEEVRHALGDFTLLAQWEEFDNRAALRGDIARKSDSNLTDDDAIAEMNRILGLARFLLPSMSPEALEELYRLALYREIESQSGDDSLDLEDIEVNIEVDSNVSEDE